MKEKKFLLKKIIKSELIKPKSNVIPLLTETDELTSILFVSIKTAKNNEKND